MNSGDFSIPDFVVVGGHVDDWVVLLASKSMSESELKEELRYPDLIERFDRYALPPVYDIRIIAKVYDYVMVRAETYSEAWQSLFKMWSPEPESRREIDGRKEIEWK
jgi:uncharacterized membrane protein YkvA (DUF1232 family)